MGCLDVLQHDAAPGRFRQQRFPDARFFQYMKREWIALTRSLPQSVARAEKLAGGRAPVAAVFMLRATFILPTAFFWSDNLHDPLHA